MTRQNKKLACKVQMFLVYCNIKIFWSFILFRRINKTAKSDYQFLHVYLSVFLSASMNNSTTTGRILMKFDVWENSGLTKFWQE